MLSPIIIERAFDERDGFEGQYYLNVVEPELEKIAYQEWESNRQNYD